MDTFPQSAEVFALKLECPVSARSKRQLRVKDGATQSREDQEVDYPGCVQLAP